jgi:chemosensory pili system protein ChpC
MRGDNSRRSFVEQGMRCVLIPVGQKHLLLPNAAVAEIFSFREPKVRVDAPRWLLGMLDWRGLNIPVITWERLVEKQEPAWKSQRMYIAILNTLNKNPAVTHIGLLSIGVSRLIRIRADVLTEDNDETLVSPLIKSAIHVSSSMASNITKLPAWIPDLDELEKVMCSLT